MNCHLLSKLTRKKKKKKNRDDCHMMLQTIYVIRTESIVQETKYCQIAALLFTYQITEIKEIKSVCHDVAHTKPIPHWNGQRNKGFSLCQGFTILCVTKSSVYKGLP